ncbi:cysteine--tRNA ligase [Candidatus Woesearchaeota archaeon]|nr:cysteine--tRNA ligase [Candidatus Woesearchaeota archaeon]
MPLQIYSTLSRKKELFKPLVPGKVGMYVCGPTVYDKGHLGHARAAIALDLVRRYLLYKGFKVKYVMNYTDIDDKIINRAREMSITPEKLAESLIPIYREDYARLGVMKPSVAPKATEHVREMAALIKKLENNGHTYVLDDGVYFDISTWPEYGKLSRQDITQLRAGARVEVDEKKKHPQDFVLWKFKKPGEPSWKSPWGDGRPGWHIECSAMTMKHLGKTFDIHGGGQDLIFPHHEDELAQSECATGQPFAKYWMHNGFVTVDNEKMSKSLGNFFTIKDILAKYDASVVRYYLLSTHYRSPINFSDKLLDAAGSSLERINEFITNLQQYQGKAGKETANADTEKSAVAKRIVQAQKEFENGLDDDIETTVALAALFDLIRDANTLLAAKKLSGKDAKACLKFLKDIDRVLAVMAFKKEKKAPPEILKLVAQREEARKKKDWKEADRLRTAIVEKGYAVADTGEGPRVKKA